MPRCGAVDNDRSDCETPTADGPDSAGEGQDPTVEAGLQRTAKNCDHGRVLAPEMPEDWKPLVEKANGMTTGTRVTERGVEYLAICKKREVNDDVAAEMVFRAEDLAKAKGGEDDANSKKYVAELRKKATITER